MRWVLVFGLASLAISCDKPIKQESIEIKVDPLAVPKSILSRYAEGQPLGSEASDFESIVNSVREVDPAKAEVLKAGFAEIEKAKGPALKAKAKELLGKLGS